MSERFAAAAVRHAGLAARVLGWRPGEFWAATPQELVASLGIPAEGPAGLVGRGDLLRMMEQDDGRSG